MLFFISPLQAQVTKVPRTLTFPGIENPAFPYAQPEEMGLSGEKLNRLGDEIESWVVNGDLVGGELLIIKDGKAVFHEAYGWSDREARKPVERNSIWSIKSMTKPVTATAVLMLAEQGALSLDDKVSKYIRGFAGDERTTIRHLLSQTSGDQGGHGGGGYNVYDFNSLEEWVLDWAQQEPTGTFGEFSYSNFNYAALGYIVEMVSGAPVEVFITKRIFKPLGLEETFTSFSTDVPWVSRLSNRYRWSDETRDYEPYWTTDEKQPWSFFPAAFGLWGTAMDYAKFMALWMNKGQFNGVRLLEVNTVAEALQPHGYIGDEPICGYGWFIEMDTEAGEMPGLFRHAGADGTIALALPSNDTMILWLTHSQGVDHLSAIQNRLGMLSIFDHPGPYMIRASTYEVQEITLASTEHARYTGMYLGSYPGDEDAHKIIVRVWAEHDNLNMRFGSSGMNVDQHFHLVPLGGHQFLFGRYVGGKLEAVDPYIKIRFTMEDGKAIAIKALLGEEIEFSARRIEQ